MGGRLRPELPAGITRNTQPTAKSGILPADIFKSFGSARQHILKSDAYATPISSEIGVFAFCLADVYHSVMFKEMPLVSDQSSGEIQLGLDLKPKMEEP